MTPVPVSVSVHVERELVQDPGGHATEKRGEDGRIGPNLEFLQRREIPHVPLGEHLVQLIRTQMARMHLQHPELRERSDGRERFAP